MNSCEDRKFLLQEIWKKANSNIFEIAILERTEKKRDDKRKDTD